MSEELDKISFKSTEDDSPNSNTVASAELKSKFRKVGVLGGPEKKQSTLNLLTLESKQSSMKKMEPYHKYLIFWNHKQNSQEFTMEIQVELPDSCLVSEAIKCALDLFNQKFQEEKTNNIIFLSDPDMFELCFAKKNGKPKTDLPALDYNQMIYMAGSKTFTLTEKFPLQQVTAKESGKALKKSVTTPMVAGESPLTVSRRSNKSSKTTKESDSHFDEESPMVVERSNSSILAKSIFNNSLINSAERKSNSKSSVVAEGKKSQNGCKSILTFFSLCSRPTCNI